MNNIHMKFENEAYRLTAPTPLPKSQLRLDGVQSFFIFTIDSMTANISPVLFIIYLPGCCDSRFFSLTAGLLVIGGVAAEPKYIYMHEVKFKQDFVAMSCWWYWHNRNVLIRSALSNRSAPKESSTCH